MITTAIASFVLACLLSSALTALAIRLSPRIGLVDHPDQQRKLQAHPIPLGGGAAVFLATVAVLGGLVCSGGPWRMQVNEDWVQSSRCKRRLQLDRGPRAAGRSLRPAGPAEAGRPDRCRPGVDRQRSADPENRAFRHGNRFGPPGDSRHRALAHRRDQRPEPPGWDGRHGDRHRADPQPGDLCLGGDDRPRGGCRSRRWCLPGPCSDSCPSIFPRRRSTWGMRAAC